MDPMELSCFFFPFLSQFFVTERKNWKITEFDDRKPFFWGKHGSLRDPYGDFSNGWTVGGSRLKDFTLGQGLPGIPTMEAEI